MKPGDFVSIPYYHYTAYGYIESISEYNRTAEVILAYKYNRNTGKTSWDKSGILLKPVTLEDCILIQSTPYKEDKDELINMSLDRRDEAWFKELMKG